MESEYLKTIQAKDPSVIAQIVNDHAQALLGAAWGVGWRGADAEDIVQDTLVTFLKTCDRFEGRSTVKTYLFGILYNKTLEKRRSSGRELATDPVDQVFEDRFGLGGIWKTFPQGPEKESQSKETMALLEECLQSLPDAQRLSFYLREVEHESTESICKILNLTVTHLGVLIFRARNRLRECVQKKWEHK